MKRDEIQLALAAFVIAFLLWFQTQPLFEPGKQLEFAVPLEYRGLDSDRLVAISSPEPVMVVASGTRNDLDKLNTDSVVAFVDLSAAQEGTKTFVVQTSGGANGVDIEPKTRGVEVAIETLVRKVVPVEIFTKGVAPDSLLYISAETNPEEVLVFGPKSYFEKFKKARVTLDLSILQSGKTEDLPVEVFDADGKPVPLMNSEPASVTISPKIQASPVTKKLFVNVNTSGSLPAGYRLDEVVVTPSQLQLMGSGEALSMVGALETESIDLTGLKESIEKRVKVKIPSGATSAVSEVTVKLKIILGGR